jgi:hypothetical protein
MSEIATSTDLGFGLGLLFGVMAVVGAASMFLNASDHLLAGWSFGLAMLAAGLSVAAYHLFTE